MLQVYSAQEVCDNSMTLVKSTHSAVILGEGFCLDICLGCGFS